MNPTGAAPIKLLIADDHPVVRDGLSSMFARDPEFEVLGEARTARRRSASCRR
jgi:DNA-binding NarL/FixJ family response regulator